MLSAFDDEVEALRAGRDLNHFDLAAVETVAGLILRVREAQEAIQREGTIVDDGKGFPVEHPALVIEKRASQEIRGWVQQRPDLFGQQKQSRRARGGSGLKAV